MEKMTRTQELQARSKRCRCKYCGGTLEVQSIVFNDLLDARTELFCTHCSRIEYGVEQEVYQCAVYFVDTFDYNAFPDMDATALTRQMSVAKVCDIIDWAVKQLGLLEREGFCVPIKMKTNLMGKCLHLDDEQLAAIKEAAGEHGGQLGY